LYLELGGKNESSNMPDMWSKGNSGILLRMQEGNHTHCNATGGEEMKFTLKIGYIIGSWERTWGSGAHGIELMIGLRLF